MLNLFHKVIIVYTNDDTLCTMVLAYG